METHPRQHTNLSWLLPVADSLWFSCSPLWEHNMRGWQPHCVSLGIRDPFRSELEGPPPTVNLPCWTTFGMAGEEEASQGLIWAHWCTDARLVAPLSPSAFPNVSTPLLPSLQNLHRMWGWGDCWVTQLSVVWRPSAFSFDLTKSRENTGLFLATDKRQSLHTMKSAFLSGKYKNQFVRHFVTLLKHLITKGQAPTFLLIA